MNFETFKGEFNVVVYAKLLHICHCCVYRHIALALANLIRRVGGDSHILSRYSAEYIQLPEDLFAWAQAQLINPTELFFFLATPGSYWIPS